MPPSPTSYSAATTTADGTEVTANASAICLASAPRPLGRNATTSAPTSGTAIRTVSQGKSLMRGSPPAAPARRGARRPGSRARRSGRSRSARAGRRAPIPPTAVAPPVKVPSTTWRSKVSRPRGEPPARLDHEAVVDRVAVDVGARGPGHERDVLRGLARDVAAADEHDREPHADRDDRDHDRGDRERRHRRVVVRPARRRPAPATPRSSRRAASRRRAPTARRARSAGSSSPSATRAGARPSPSACSPKNVISISRVM